MAATAAQMIAEIAHRTGMSKADIKMVLEEFDQLVYDELDKYGSVTVPGIVKLTLKDKKATPPRPFALPNGNVIMTKGSPAKLVIKAKPVKKLKDAL